MDEAFNLVLAEYEERSAAEQGLMESADPAELLQRLNELLLPIGPDTGRLLNILIKAAKSQSILELGTSYCYSTLWLADAAADTDGRVVSLELADYKAAYAREALGRAHLADRVSILVGSVLDTLPRLKGPFDFVLIDVWKDLYVPCLDLLYPKLSPGAFVVADNMIYPQATQAEVASYRRRVRELEFDSVLLPVGSGIELSRRR
jgi:predicted O-methyltransferase YrrM